jgi:hypothetical protein
MAARAYQRRSALLETFSSSAMLWYHVICARVLAQLLDPAKLRRRRAYILSCEAGDDSR